MTEHRNTTHLVGSVPLNSSAEVFETVCQEIGGLIKRLPDGETGDRSSWISFQRQMLMDHEAMEPDSSIPLFAFTQWDGKVLREVELLKLKDGVDVDNLTFPIGYAEHAIASFAEFQRLQSSGVIPADVLFQVSLPTAFATGYNYVSPNGREKFLEVFERSIGVDVSKILDAIPHDRLSIQWDVCQEVLIFENYFPDRSASYKQDIYDQLARLSALIPADVDLGFHLCYGSPADDHVVKPKDFAVSVEMANGIFANVDRRIDFMHLPGTYDRLDDAFYAPLKDLKVPDGCALYLGLLFQDDRDGDAQRIRAARKAIPDFGIATVCGWGRANPAIVPGILESHKIACGNSG